MAHVCFLGLFYMPETPSQFDTWLMLPIWLQYVLLYSLFYLSFCLIHFSSFLIISFRSPATMLMKLVFLLIFSSYSHGQDVKNSLAQIFVISQFSMVFQLLIILMFKIALLQLFSFCSLACQIFNIFSHILCGKPHLLR